MLALDSNTARHRVDARAVVPPWMATMSDAPTTFADLAHVLFNSSEFLYVE